MIEPPELWWSSSLAEETGEPRDGLVYHPADGRWFRNRGGWWHAVTQMPTDIRSLVLAEPVDEKGRGPSYLRGFADGRMAERANSPAYALESKAITPELEDLDGWDCQAGAQWRWAPSREQAISQGLTNDEREQLGVTTASTPRALEG